MATASFLTSPVGEAAVGAFRAHLHGELLAPSDPGYDVGPAGLQRHDRPPAGVDRPSGGRGRCPPRRPLRPRARLAVLRQGRWAQRGWQRRLRRRADARSVVAEGRPGRPGAAHRGGPARTPAGRPRPRHAGVRSRDPARDRLDDRHRRTHPRWRDRLAQRQARPGLRQPARRRHRDRRRRTADARAPTRMPTSSGPSAVAAATSAW